MIHAEEIESLISFYENTLHDIKTPISIIYLYLQNMFTDCISQSRDSSFFEQISISLKHCESVIELLRGAADAGMAAQFPVSALSRHDLSGLAAAVSDTMNALAARKGVTISYQTSSDSVFILGDKQMLERVIINVISNAIKYTPNGGAVSVSVELSNGMGFLTVTDTGSGFTNDALKNPFKRYSRSDSSYASQGIGLSIVHEIVQALNGRVDIRNGESGGAVVTIKLPAVPSAPEQPTDFMTM